MIQKIIYKLIGHTSKEPIEINHEFINIKLRRKFENLNPTNKVCFVSNNEIWLYEQPQTTLFLISQVSFT
jgi:hypothetical protein